MLEKGKIWEMNPDTTEIGFMQVLYQTYYKIVEFVAGREGDITGEYDPTLQRLIKMYQMFENEQVSNLGIFRPATVHDDYVKLLERNGRRAVQQVDSVAVKFLPVEIREKLQIENENELVYLVVFNFI